MTVIAWDGKTLAADRLLCDGTTPMHATKIYKVQTPDGPVMLGVAGRTVCATPFRMWAQGGFELEKWPTSLDREEYTALVVLPNGDLWEFEDDPYPIVLPPQARAIGSGAIAASTAMHLGLNAKRAAEVACELTTGCGMGVDTLSFTKAERRG